MSSKPASHRVFFVFTLLAALVLASLPAQARTVRRSTATRNSVTVSGDSILSGIWRFAVSLWPGGTTKEGVLIDPNGGANQAGTSAGDLTNEGMSIDPDGIK